VHVVIVGCGRVGSALAADLVERGHSVAMIDRRSEALARLGDSFAWSNGSNADDVPGRGRKMIGIGFDRGVLISAGIEHADAVAAVTSGDNSNILVARVARENFGIERVVARIYDPKRAAVYQRLGIATVATVSWTTERVLRRVLPTATAIEWVDPSAQVSLVERQIDPSNAGRTYADIESSSDVKVIAVSRLGAATLVSANLVAQEGDLMYLAVASDAVDRLDTVLARPAVHGH
jgi:trk system potassium uptake protein TrkA